MKSKYEFNIESREMFYRYPERYRLEPFRIYGNLYFTGNKSVGSYLIDTGEGLILIDTTYPTTVALLVHSIWSLGFKPQDIKMIVHTHGHFDHFGGTAFLTGISGAKTYLAEGDANMFLNQPELALTDCCKYSYTEPFVPDVVLHDGDVIKLGNTRIRIVTTPGHSDGVISLFFEAEENGVRRIVGLQGGAGLNTLCRPFLEKYKNYHSREDFVRSLDKIQNEPVDIMLGNHTGQNRTEEKRRKMLEQPEGENPFIDREEWGNYIQTIRKKYMLMLEEEAAGTDIQK